MDNDVLYMSFSNKESGMIFPNELDEDIYSPGIWVIQSSSKEDCPTHINIDAIIKEELITLIARKNIDNHYEVEIPSNQGLDPIVLKIKKVHYRHQKYVGQSSIIKRDLSFFQLVPIDIPYLENLCLEKGIYLIGKIDKRLGNNFD